MEEPQMRTKTSDGAPNAVVDWEAYQELQRLRAFSSDSFVLNCLEDACDRLLKRPQRASKGKALANSLFRDSRKNSRLLKSQLRRIDDTLILASEAHNPSEALARAETDLLISQKLSHGLAQLDSRQRRAVHLKFSSHQVDDGAQRLGVKQRQFRNIVKSALDRLRIHILAETEPPFPISI